MGKDLNITVRRDDEEKGGMGSFNDKLDVLQHMTSVKSRGIMDDITDDFVLAKLDEKDREGVVNMTANAYFGKDLVLILKEFGSRS